MLQKDAYKVLEKLQLMELLKNFGEPKIVGSLSLGLMTWRDIDLETVCKELKKEYIAAIVATLISNFDRRIDFGMIDNRLKEHFIIPKGMYIGCKYFGEDIPVEELKGSNPNVWKIDMWFGLKGDNQGFQKTEEIKSKLTKEKRRIILEIKEKVSKNPKFRKEIFSVDIYDAVLENGVNNLNEFEQYLKQRGRLL
ncbi:hypothetical protein HYS93_04905 [Candidatus Daviesbacteria bacterium]|nr:hypothetical protein [Candidatus Daviesbacteria bacterium]